MNRTTTTAALLVPVAAGTLMVSGCGSKTTSSSTSAATTTAAATTAATSGATTAASVDPTTPSQCPTSNTRSFAKTRFVADVGLAAGTFHRYILTPYQAGSFQKGAAKRTSSLVKAAGTAALDAKLIDNAYKNVQASPALCKALVVPMGQLKDGLTTLKGQLTSGNVASIASIDQLVKSVEQKSDSNGAAITEQDSTSAAESAASQG